MRRRLKGIYYLSRRVLKQLSHISYYAEVAHKINAHKRK